MELFKAEKIGEMESAATKKCPNCNQKLELIRTVFVSSTWNLIRMFECKCGERIWEE